MVISIQAYIFTMLTAFYIAESIHGHGAEDEHDAELHTMRKQEAEPEYETELATA